MNWTYLLSAPITLFLLITTLCTSLLALWRDDWRDHHTLVPYDTLMYHEYWRMLSSGFVHGNGFHLGFNLLTLLFFGTLLEHRLGHWQMLILYMFGLLISSLGVTLRYRKDAGYVGTLGASGAISAVVLSVVVLHPFLRFGLPFLTDWWPWLSLPAWFVGSAYLLYTLVSMWLPQKLPINHDAHWWGAVGGIALTFALKPQAAQIMQQVLAQF